MLMLMNAVKITSIFTGKNHFNMFSKPINLVHLIEIFVVIKVVSSAYITCLNVYLSL